MEPEEKLIMEGEEEDELEDEPPSVYVMKKTLAKNPNLRLLILTTRDGKIHAVIFFFF